MQLYLKQWRPAARLRVGEPLLTANGATATADGGTIPKDHTAWMWDLTIPGNNDHDFYIAVAATAILVHNCGDIRVSSMSSDWATKGAHVHIGGNEVRVFPNGEGGVGAEPIRLRVLLHGQLDRWIKQE